MTTTKKPPLTDGELIRRMESHARALIVVLGKQEARKQIEKLLMEAETIGKFHPGFPEAILALGIKFEELLKG